MTRSRDVANIDTILTTKGDIYAASAAYTPTRLAVGNNGETLVADSSTSTGLRYNPQNALANPVINGGFDIWQRGTSQSFGANNAFWVADRWKGYASGNASVVSRQTTGDTTNLPNIQYSLRFQRNSGQTSTSPQYLANSFETTNSLPFVGKTVTLSFYAKAGANYSASSNALLSYLYSGTGTDQNWIDVAYTGQATAVSGTATLTTSWQRFAFTGTISSSATELVVVFQSGPTGTAGANDWFEVTGVQIDLGTYTASSAPTFRRSGGTLAGELAACQRYYWRATAGSIYQAFASGHANATTNAQIFLANPVIMRTTPTSVDYSQLGLTNSAASIISATSAAINYAGPQGTMLSVFVSSGLTAGNGSLLTAANSTSAYIGMNAEL